MLFAQTGGAAQACLSWSYTLVVDQNFPSRMAVVKNVLGNSVTITTPWVQPGAWPAFTNPNWQCGSCTITGPDTLDVAPTAVGQHWQHTYKWTITFPEPVVDPGPPFGLYATPATDPTRQPIAADGTQLTWPNVYTDAGDVLGSGAQVQPPLDVVGANASLVNWGLMVFSTKVDYVAGVNLGDNTKHNHILAMIDTSDKGDVTAVENAMQLFANGGTNAFGSTPTRGALGPVTGSVGTANAETILQYVAQGTSTPQDLVDDLGNSFTLPPDPKLDCGRQYASILVTDGLSNVGNPGGCPDPTDNWGNWIEPCLPCACGSVPTNQYSGGAGCPDGGDSGVTCPDLYTKFAAGQAENAWLASVLDPVTGQPRQLKARTFTIGISPEVGPCELNYIAYRGRTDASDPSGLVGIDSASGPDPYLPEGSPGTYDGLTASGGCPAGVSHTPVHGNYAFFAQSAGALYDALTKLLAAFGVGDYTTSGGTTTNTAYVTAATNVGFITSGEYPTWRGHIYAYDLNSPIVCRSDGDCPTVSNGAGRCNVVTGDCLPPDTFPLLWDAGQVLKANNDGSPRRIYTWNPQASGNKLVAIETANEGTLNTICGNCGIDDHVVDFIRGNDGNGNPRPWQLGAIVNSTAALIGKPEQWKQFTGHSSFETEYAGRNTVAWIGASDGMIHAFDLKDGAELVALIPPDLLAKQVTLYNNYKSNPTDDSMGQKIIPGEHLYGVASSPRFADVWDGNEYRTLMFITEGPGGTGVHAIDVTHPTPPRTYADGTTYPGDPNYGYGTAYVPSNPEAAPPVQPLWSLTNGGAGLTTAVADLGQSWSIPAVGGTQNGTNWELMLGGGYTPYDANVADTANPSGNYIRLNPMTGAVRSDNRVSPLAATQTLGGPWVREQMFAHSTLWSTVAGYYDADNDVNEGVQADLQGRVWLLERQNMSTSNWKTPTTLSDPSGVIAGEPLYYTPAVANYPSVTPQYNVFAFSSGTFYEASKYINGLQVGLDAAPGDPPNFIPALYLAARTTGNSPTTTIQRIEIRSITSPDGGTTFTINPGSTPYFGHRTQVTSSPLILVPTPGSTGKVIALYLLFDPDAGCKGLAYVVRLDFDPGNLAAINVKVANAGEGAASGLALAGTLPVVSKSFAGSGGKAYFFVVKDLPIMGAGGAGAPISWWQELQ